MPLPTPPERLLLTTARSTFESLALLFAEPLAGPPGGPLGDSFGDPLGDGPLGAGAVAARVAFAGEAAGRALGGALTLAVSADVAAALAENMLGAAGPGGPGPEARRDAVGEVANVVCGHLVSAAAGPAAVFRLAAPAAVPAGAPAGPWHAWLDVEGGRAWAALDAPDALFAAGATA